jgi:FKBP-type peptidyl-prolyl cis-trans isomerase SlyD
MPPDKIEKDVVVSLQYSLKLDNGSLVEESSENEPLMYLHGHDNIVPGLERRLEGLGVADRVRVAIEAEDAYGKYDPEQVEQIKRSDLPPEIRPEIGMILGVRAKSGDQYAAHITGVDVDSITLDFNHPLAGERLHFDVTVLALRDASDEELQHGHVHEEGEHHH